MKPAGDERTPDGREHALYGPQHEQLLNVTITDGDAVVVTVRGEVDGLTAPRLRGALEEGFERAVECVLIIDLAEVEFFGSAGLRVLLDSARKAARTPGFQPVRVVVDDNRPVILPIEIVGLDNVLKLYGSVGDAVAG